MPRAAQLILPTVLLQQRLPANRTWWGAGMAVGRSSARASTSSTQPAASAVLAAVAAMRPRVVLRSSHALKAGSAISRLSCSAVVRSRWAAYSSALSGARTGMAAGVRLCEGQESCQRRASGANKQQAGTDGANRCRVSNKRRRDDSVVAQTCQIRSVTSSCPSPACRRCRCCPHESAPTCRRQCRTIIAPSDAAVGAVRCRYNARLVPSFLARIVHLSATAMAAWARQQACSPLGTAPWPKAWRPKPSCTAQQTPCFNHYIPPSRL